MLEFYVLFWLWTLSLLFGSFEFGGISFSAISVLGGSPWNISARKRKRSE
jgi:hypothetical protein